MYRFFCAATTVSLLAGCAASAMMKPYDQSMLPAPVQVPAGNKVAMETVGMGEITYECRAQGQCRPGSSNGSSSAPMRS